MKPQTVLSLATSVAYFSISISAHAQYSWFHEDTGSSSDLSGATCNRSDVCEYITQQGSGDGLQISSQGTGISISSLGSAVAATTRSANGAAVVGNNTGNPGNDGVLGSSSNSNGVYGTTNASYPYAGVYGTATGSTPVGVHGKATGSASTGVDGETDNGYAVLGYATGSGYGVYGYSASGYAIYASGKAGGTTSWNSSDARLKKDIREGGYGIEQVLRLRPVTYLWKDEHYGKGTQFGLVAQEVQRVFPELVQEDPNGMLAMNYVQLIPVLVRAIQQQQAEIARLNERNRAPLMSSLLPGGLGGLALGALPLAVFGVWRKRSTARGRSGSRQE